MHEFLIEIYSDFCLKNDMPKHSESSPLKGYLSVDDLMHVNYPLTKPQRDWLKNYNILWEATMEGRIYKWKEDCFTYPVLIDRMICHHHSKDGMTLKIDGMGGVNHASIQGSMG